MTVSINGVKKQTLNIGQTINGQNPEISGLIAHYTFDDISGTTVADETGSFPGTLINGPTVVNGQLGNGTDFDTASDQYVDAGIAMGNDLGNGVSALSVSLWFKLNSTTGNTGLFYIGDALGNHGKFSAYVQSNAIKFLINGGTFISDTPFTDTIYWHHILAMYTGSRGVFYVDNIKLTDSAHSTDLDLTGLKTLIGTYFNVFNTFDGKIDQVRIFNKELTVPEINMLFNEKVGAWIYENGRRL